MHLIGVQAQRLAEQGFRTFHLAARRELLRQTGARRGQLRIVLRGPFEALHGVLELVRLDQQVAEVEIGLGARGVEQQGVLEGAERMRLPSQLLQRRAEVVPAVRVAGIDPDGLGEATGRVLKLAVLRIHTPEVGPGARIVGCQLAGSARMAHRQPGLSACGMKLRQMTVRVGIVGLLGQPLAATVERARKVSGIESGL